MTRNRSERDILTAAIQAALNDAAAGGDPLRIYKPSPGQIADHVHHRIARIAADAAIDALRDARAEQASGAASIAAGLADLETAVRNERRGR